MVIFFSTLKYLFFPRLKYVELYSYIETLDVKNDKTKKTLLRGYYGSHGLLPSSYPLSPLSLCTQRERGERANTKPFQHITNYPPPCPIKHTNHSNQPSHSLTQHHCLNQPPTSNKLFLQSKTPINFHPINTPTSESHKTQGWSLTNKIQMNYSYKIITKPNIIFYPTKTPTGEYHCSNTSPLTNI